MRDEPYLDYCSESEYHEHHTLLALLELEESLEERMNLIVRIGQIEANCRMLIDCRRYDQGITEC